MFLHLKDLFHKENTLFKEKDYASRKSILFSWLYRVKEIVGKHALREQSAS
jgi:hypothetical protein